MITDFVLILGGFRLNFHKRMSSDAQKKCIINLRLRDKKSLSQKLIVKSSRFHEFWHCEIVCYNLRLWDRKIYSYLIKKAATQ